MNTSASLGASCASECCWPVILHQSLANGELHQLLNKHKIRVSAAIPANSVIFPLSSVVFGVETITDAVTEWPPLNNHCHLHPHLIQRLNSRLASMCHYSQYILLVATILGCKELSVVTALQREFLHHDVQLIPVHNMTECMDTMINIAKVTCQPVSDIVNERLQRAIGNMLTESTVLSALSTISPSHLTPHDTTVLYDGCGSLHSIAHCTRDQLLTDMTSLDHNTASEVYSFLNNNTQ